MKGTNKLVPLHYKKKKEPLFQLKQKNMKKLIFTLLFFFIGINCFANPIDDLQGEWNRIISTEDKDTLVNRALTFSKDSLIIDDMYEGFGYTYKINNDIIEVYNLKDFPFGFSKADFYIKLLSDIGDDNLTIVFIDRVTGEEGKRCTYIKTKD